MSKENTLVINGAFFSTLMMPMQIRQVHENKEIQNVISNDYKWDLDGGTLCLVKEITIGSTFNET